MSALEDIRVALDRKRAEPSRAGLFGGRPKFKVVVGYSAELSVRAETDGHRLPVMIDGAVVEQTKQFNGWEVTEL